MMGETVVQCMCLFSAVLVFLCFYGFGKRFLLCSFGATHHALGQKYEVVACGMKSQMALLSISLFNLQNLPKVGVLFQQVPSRYSLVVIV